VLSREAIVTRRYLQSRRALSGDDLSKLHRALGGGKPLVTRAVVGALQVDLESADAGEVKFGYAGPFIRISIKNIGSKIVHLKTPTIRELGESPRIHPNNGTMEWVSALKPAFPVHHPIHGNYETTRLATGEAKTWFLDPLYYLKEGYVPDPAITYEVRVKPFLIWTEEGDVSGTDWANILSLDKSAEFQLLGIRTLKLAK
jgi:hypothetical protein